MDLALHWPDEPWPEFLHPLIDALQTLPEAESAADGTVVLCPDATRIGPPEDTDAPAVAFVPHATHLLEPPHTDTLRKTLAPWSARGTLFLAPTTTAAVGLSSLLSVPSASVAALALPLPPERLPAASEGTGTDVLAPAPIAFALLLNAFDGVRLSGLEPRLVFGSPQAERLVQPGGEVCAFDLLPGREATSVADWRDAVPSAGAIVLCSGGVGLGWTLREALATGRPVVAPSFPVVRDHLNDLGAACYMYLPYQVPSLARAIIAALRRDRPEGLEQVAQDAVVGETYQETARRLYDLLVATLEAPARAASHAPASFGPPPATRSPRIEIDQRLELCVLNPNPSGGGGERFMRQLVAGMAHHRSAPRIKLVCQVDPNAFFDPGSDQLARAGVELHPVAAGDFATAAAREIASSDVAYYSWPHRVDPPHAHVPIACTFHDLNWKHFDVISEADKFRLERQTPAWIERASAFVHSSRFIRDELHRYYEAPESLTHVIPTAADPPPTPPTADERAHVRRRFALPDRFILSPNGYHLHKNYPALTAALRILRRQGRPVTVIATGMATDVYNGPDLIGLGYISARNLQALYEECDGMVQTTLYEAGSFPMVEAMAAGKPVAISRIAPIVEQVERVGVVAELFDPLDPEAVAEGLWRIWDGCEATRPETLAANARAVAARTWDDVAGDYLALLSSLRA